MYAMKLVDQFGDWLACDDAEITQLARLCTETLRAVCDEIDQCLAMPPSEEENR